MGQRATECRLSKRKRNQAQVMEDITQEVDDIDLSAVISEVNLVGSNPKEWWIYTGATRHVCSDRSMFTFFKPKKNGKKLVISNSTTSKIQDIKDSKSTSGYVFTLASAAMTWKSSKQTVIARSTMESAFIALDKCGEKAE
ncbi:secreted RxLR effector protein 161-like [Ziziphus jujuba]|uniref:Secreted RxLR effector protein 161-like n=1 Tax=Ziziphus jujuba TaxID=326968 RepID=A0ABM3I3Z5_ZIZJJ|nr:secreted RxLR effector protein 161-like [Ziziphus jujuba]